MGKPLTATYDGSVLKPDETLDLEANTRVRLTIEKIEVGAGLSPGKKGFVRAAGGWKELMDCDRLVDNIYESRRFMTRREPRL